MSAIKLTEVPNDGDHKTKDASQTRIRRRNRMITSCLECRRRKLKCDKLQPCTNCSKFSRDCMFLAPALDSVSQKKLTELKERMGSLERVLEDDIARRTLTAKTTTIKARRRPSNDLPGEESNSDHESPVPEDEKRLEATPMAGFDAAYDEGGSEDVLDVGIRIGLLRLTERVGGMFRPRLSEEVAIQLGAPIRKDLDDPEIPNLPDQDDFVSPGSDFIAPGAGFIFGDVGSRRNLVDYLPTKGASDSLLQHYYRNCQPVAKVVHWPSFQVQYNNFWSTVLSGIEPPASLQALVLAVLFSAVVSMRDEDVMNLFGGTKQNVLANFQSGSEVALARANFLRTTKVETLQAFVIYLLPMCRDAISRAHSVLAGTAVRLGECMGLHRDPAENFGLTPVEAHVRRILWFQLCFLDYWTADKQGPRPTIRREDYDTKFPLNVNDAKIADTQITEDDPGWTDMTLTRLRFECCEMWRVARIDIERLHQKKISVTHALGRIESFRRAMEAKYFPILDESIPIRRYAKYIMKCQIHKMHIALLHRYHFAVEALIPDRLRQVIIDNGVATCEAAMEVYRDQDYRDWSWYNGALCGFPTAALLALEIFTYPNRREADRIWAILDFVFRPEASLGRDLKARQILSAIRDRTAFYRSLRGLRVPVSMQNRLDTTLPIRRIRMGGAEMLIPQNGILQKEASLSPEETTSSSSETAILPRADLTHTRSPTAPVKTQPHPENTDNPAEPNWTFENPYTFLTDSKPKPPKSRTSSSSSPAAVQLSPTGGMPPGLDTGHSPSGSSTNTESWPPPISTEQHGWRYAFSSPSPQQAHASKPRQMSHTHYPPPVNIQHNHAQSQQQQPPPHAQQHYAPPYGNTAMGSMNNMYMPSGHPSSGPMTYGVPEHSVASATNSIAALVGMNPSEAHAHLQQMQGHVIAGPNQIPMQHDGSVDAPMLDINWAEWDRIFPPEVNTGHLDNPDHSRT